MTYQYQTRFCTGWERNPHYHAGIPNENMYWYGYPYTSPYEHNAVVIGATNEDAHTGDYSLKVTGTTSTDWASVAWYLNSKSKAKVGFWYKPSLIYGTYDETCFFNITDDYSKNVVKLYWNEDGTVYGYHNLLGLLCSDPGHPVDEWMHIGVVYFNHPLHGVWALYINGKEVHNFYGNTNASTYRDLLYFRFGSYPYDATRNQGTPVGSFYDDMYMETGIWSDATSAPIDMRILDIDPNADGYMSEWAPTGPIVDHYKAVNYSHVAGDDINVKSWDHYKYEYFAMENINALGLSIPVVMLKWFAKQYGAYPDINMYPGIRTNGVDYVYSYTRGNGSSWAFEAYPKTTDAQGNIWTENTINGLEMFFRSNQL